MNYNKIVELSKAKKVTIKELTEAIGMTRQGLQGALDNETLELRKMKLLCDVLRISPAMFFETGTFGVMINATGHVQNGSNNNLIIESKEREIELLKQQLEDKNEIIRLLRDTKRGGYSIVAEP